MTAIVDDARRCAAAAGDAVAVESLPSIAAARGPRRRPTAVALRKKDLGRWKQYTWARRTPTRAAARRAAACARSASSRATGSPSTARTGPAWLLADLGAQGIGAVTVGIYPTSPAAEVEYLLATPEPSVLIAEDEEQLDKALAVREQAARPAARSSSIDPRGVRHGRRPDAHDASPSSRRSGATADAPTWPAAVGRRRARRRRRSSSTRRAPPARPRARCSRHANLLAAADDRSSARSASPSDDEVLSYLPLCHVAERLISVHRRRRLAATS